MFQWFAELWNALTSIGGSTQSRCGQDWYSCLKDFQTAIAAIIALVSVFVGLLGSIAVQWFSHMLDVHKRKANVRTTIYAELSLIERSMKLSIMHLDRMKKKYAKEDTPEDDRDFYIRPIPEVHFIEAATSDIGLLPQRHVEYVLASYGYIEAMRARALVYSHIESHADSYLNVIDGLEDKLIEDLESTTERIRKTRKLLAERKIRKSIEKFERYRANKKIRDDEVHAER